MIYSNNLPVREVQNWACQVTQLNTGFGEINMPSSGLRIAGFQEIVPGLASADIQVLEPALLKLDLALTLRTYLDGYHVGNIDQQAWTTLRTNKVIDGLVRQRRMPMNVLRWLAFIDAMHPEVQQEVKMSQARTKDHRASASRAGANYNIGLADTQRGVVTRFPPEPS